MTALPDGSGADRGARTPREELADLAHGVRGAARRARARGLRRDAPRSKRAPARADAPPPAEPKAARAPSAAPAPRSASEPAPELGIPRRPVATPPRDSSAPPRDSSAPPRDADDAVAKVRALAQSAATLDELRASVAACRACGLCATRTQTVFVDGKGKRRILFVGEAPGAEEDRTGVPFVGRAGQLLTDIITKGMGLARDDVWIANVLKCRPPENRDPSPREKELCTPFLDRQIELMDPVVIIPLGRHAAMHVLGIEASMSAMRGKVHVRKGRPVVPTFHPAYLLRSPGEKKECWKDIQLAMDVIGLKPPKRGADER